MAPKSQPQTGRYAYEGLERVLHERSRLGILSSLAGRPAGLTFAELKSLVSLTDGNLSRQIQVLADEKLIEIEKTFVDNRPQTRCKMTVEGRKRFLDYVDELERVVRDAAAVQSAAGLRARAEPG